MLVEKSALYDGLPTWQSDEGLHSEAVTDIADGGSHPSSAHYFA